MRITGGTYARRRIVTPKHDIRPAMDRMRESVFASLGDIDGASFLDLFSGSGVIALEALSRGASPVELVERDRRKRQFIEKNLEIAEEPARLYILPVERYVQRATTSFDVIFLDPPFPYRHKLDLLKRIEASALVSAGTRVLIHYPSEESLPASVGTLEETDTRRYGRSLVRFYRARE
jgi:16S rRNA (guanine(966)-N(2))-methyltransferase RsmD